MVPRPSCLRLFKQLICAAFAFALDSAGKSMLARIAMIAITTSSSIRVKPESGRRPPVGKAFAFIWVTGVLPARPKVDKEAFLITVAEPAHAGSFGRVLTREFSS